MLSPLVSSRGRAARVSRTVSLPAPTKGWNVRDPLSAMKATDAVVLENWFPEAHQVRTRPGAAIVAETSADFPGTLFAYNGPSSSQLFLLSRPAGSGDYKIVQVTGNTVSAPLVSLTEGRGFHCNFATPGGNFLYLVNGVDNPQLYNGTSWTAITTTSTPAITGVPPSELAFVTAMKKRLWFARRNSLSAWYLPISSIGGSLVEFPMGDIFKRGGWLVSMASWSIDGGDGLDDHSVFVTSEGEVAVYSGSDPASASSWTLIGLFYIGEPLTRRCLTQFGGDLLYLCKYGLFPLSKALTSATIDRQTALTDKINSAFSEAVSAYGNLPGWQAIVFPGGPLLLVNVPTNADRGLSEQFVMNTLTGAWCKFTGWNAFSWAIFQQTLYFYGKGSVLLGGSTVAEEASAGIAQAWTGTSDFGDPINCNAQQAFSYFNLRGAQKHGKLVRPTLSSDGAIIVATGLDTDFRSTEFASIAELSGLAGSLWDTAKWDVNEWTALVRNERNWVTVFAREFYAAAVRLQISSSSANVRWTATDFVFEVGGVL